MAIKIDVNYPSRASIEYKSKTLLFETGHYAKLPHLLSELRRVVHSCRVIPRVVRFAQFEFHFTTVFMNHPFYEIKIL